MMVKIAETTEQDLPKKYADYAKLHTKRGVSSAVTNATVQTAENLNAKAVVCPTISGFTARLHLSSSRIHRLLDVHHMILFLEKCRFIGV